MKVTRIRAGLYNVDNGVGTFTVEQRMDIDGHWWVSDDSKFLDPNCGVYATKRDALESLRSI